MAQVLASKSDVVLGGVVLVVGSNLVRGKKFTASIGSVDSLYITSFKLKKKNKSENKSQLLKFEQKWKMFVMRPP